MKCAQPASRSFRPLLALALGSCAAVLTCAVFATGAGATGEADRPQRLSDVEKFYAQRGGAPAWLTESGEVRRRARSILQELEQADLHGLDPTDYDAAGLKESIRHLASQARPPTDIVALDARITAAALAYARDLATGRVSPNEADITAQRSDPGIDFAAALERGIAERRVRTTIAALAPPHEEYRRLVSALARYRTLAASNEWPSVAASETLEPGNRYSPKVIDALERRLAAEGSIAEPQHRAAFRAAPGARPAVAGSHTEAGAVAYGGRLASAVRSFQASRGLEADAVIGSRTLAELNRSAASIAASIALNMERWRWLPRDLGMRHIRADVPSFQLTAHDAGQPSLQMRLIAGQPDWSTPLFSDAIEYVVVNPSWHVPERIATEEILPRVAEDPMYLYRNDIDLVAGRGSDERVTQPYRVELPFFVDDFPYRLRQGPGPLNPLGRVKFVMPNHYDVYLHDTPNASLFARHNRALSHGCIRLEHPLDLAAWVLNGNAEWNRESLAQATAAEDRRTVTLDEPVPVHLTYFTADVGADGRLALRPDVYDIDAKLAAALDGSASAEVTASTAH